MRHFFTISLVFLAAQFVQAQTDTLTTMHRVVNEAFEPPKFAEANDYVFMKQVPTPHLLKIGLFNPDNNRRAQGLNSNRGTALNIDFEQKLGQAFSFNASLDFAFENALTLDFGEGLFFNPDEFRFNRIGISLEPRYYLGMKRKVKEGLQADNLSGQYIGLKVRYFGTQGLEDDFDPTTISTWFSNSTWPNQDGFEANLQFGIQRRVLKYGYLDFQVGVGMIHHQAITYSRNGENRLIPTAERGWHPQITTNITYGVAFGPGEPEEGRQCDVMLCHTEENNLFKINLARAIPQTSTNGSKYFNAGIGIAFEQKIGQSPISIQAELTADYSYNLNNGLTLLEWALEPRYYYNLKRRIAQGRSANNLSANYFALRYSQSSIYASELTSINTETFITPVWGFQRRLFKRGYIGYQVGPMLGTKFSIRSEFQVGLAL